MTWKKGKAFLSYRSFLIYVFRLETYVRPNILVRSTAFKVFGQWVYCRYSIKKKGLIYLIFLISNKQHFEVLNFYNVCNTIRSPIVAFLIK